MIKVLVPDMPKVADLLPYLRRIDESKWFTNFGALNADLETRLSQMYGSHVTTVSSCASGLELALASFRWPAGSRVLTPSLSFPATANAIFRCGLAPLYCDVDPDTWALTPAIAREAARHAAFVGIVPVCAYGAPQSTVEWEQIQKELGAMVVIDGAATFGNVPARSAIPFVVSMHATKSLGAGEGGFIVTSDDYRLTTMRRMSNFGIDPTAGNAVSLQHGTNAKLSEYAASVALAGLDVWKERLALRMSLGGRYMEALAARSPAVSIQSRPTAAPYNTFCVKLPEGVQVAHVAGWMRRCGIETRRWYVPAQHEHPGLRSETVDHLPVTRDLAERLLGLPFHLDLTAKDIAYVCLALARSLQP